MSYLLHILHLEDDPLDAELIQETLDAAGISADIERVMTKTSFEAAIASRRFDMILADYSLPGFDGLSALDTLRRSDTEMPFIFVSGALGEDAMIESLRRGATDYVLKHRLERLAPAVQRALREAAVQADRRAAEEEREHLLNELQTERTLLQQTVSQLSSSELQYRIMGETLPYGVWMCGADGHIRYISSSFLDLLQLAPERAAGSTFAEILPISAREAVEEQWRVCIESGCAWEAEFQVRGPRGEDHTVLSRGLPVRGDDGCITNWVGINLDITERKRIEIERDQLLQRQTRVAETLQRSLLLTPPENAFPRLQLRTAYEAAWDEAQVAGDFYDAFRIDDNRIALMVGDVTGKGLAAATFTAEVKFALRAYLRETASPAKALERLNRFLADTQRLDYGENDRMVSMALVTVDTVAHSIQTAIAGAEPPLIVRSSGEVQECGTPGILLNATSEWEYAETVHDFLPGDVLVICTDGLTEARRGREFFGIEGVADAARAAIASPLDKACDAIVAAAKDFGGGSLRDDACLLLARFLHPTPLA